MGGIMARVLTVLIALATAIGCSEDPVGGTTTDEFAARRDQMKASLARKAPAVATTSTSGASATDVDFGILEGQYVYQSDGRRDPFRSIHFVDDEVPTTGFGPLGDFELGQISVVAVVWDTRRPRAVVTDPGGRAFIVHEGSPIGKNSGRVVHIGDNLLLVKETYVDFEGNQSTKDVEIRIRRSQGG